MSGAVIRAVIVDDEAPARREMRRLLSAHVEMAVVAEADSVTSARSLLARTSPDVVFLDIVLGKASGFDILNDVDPQCAVVFVTAFESFAVQAFDARALSYLLKPVDPARLARTVDLIIEVRDGKSSAAGVSNATTTFSKSRWVFLDDGDRPDFVEVVTVTHVIAEEGGTRVYTSDRTSRHSAKSLSEWELRLPPDDFKRVHRGAIVNLRHVTSVERWSNYSYRLHVAAYEEPVVMSRRYAVMLKEELA